MNPEDRTDRDRELVAAALTDYAARRTAFYERTTLRRLLAKDVLMYAARGIATADEFVDAAFSAMESSSEETNMGTAWQRMIKDLAWPTAIDAGDIMAERDGALWVVEIKAQTNTLNSSSSPQTLRSLQDRVKYHSSFQQARHQPVRAMIGVLRGPDTDREEEYRVSERRNGNKDLDLFKYRYIVGRPFWRWLTGRPSVVSLLGDLPVSATSLRDQREQCVRRLKLEMAALLRQRN